MSSARLKPSSSSLSRSHPSTSSSTKHPLLRLWATKPHLQAQGVKGILYSCLYKLFDIAPEILIGVAVDMVVKQEKSFLAQLLGTSEYYVILGALGAITFIIWSLESFFEYLQKITWRNLSQKVQHILRLDGCSAVLSYKLGWFENESTGQFVTTLNEDVNQLERFLDGGLSSIIQLICSTVLVSAVFFYLSPIIAIFALMPVPVIAGWSYLFQKKLKPKYKLVRSASEHIASKLSNIFSGILIVKSFHQEQAELDELRQLSHGYVDANQDAIRTSSAFTPTVRIFILLGYLTTLLIGGHLCFTGQLGVGAYSALVFLTQRLLWPFTTLADVVDQYERAMASLNRILNLTHHPSQIENQTTQNISLPHPTELILKNICFSYPQISHSLHPASQPQKPVLNNVSLEAHQGQVIGICGETGCGKSTLIKLILRYYEPTSGSIMVSGVPLSHTSPSQIRQLSAFVSQDNYLFDTTLRKNLLYGYRQASDQELDRVIHQCRLHHWISSLPHGLDTVIGERGVKLSGGQKQRVALARALLKAAPIVILDEATSAIDSDTEKDLADVIYNLALSKIVLAIAHRLSTIQNAHRIYVLARNGTIAESGTHHELLKHGGLYQHLWNIQVKDPKAQQISEVQQDFPL